MHRHCEDRAPPCKAKIASGSYVTMSRKKVVKKLEDLDDLARFLLDKVCSRLVLQYHLRKYIFFCALECYIPGVCIYYVCMHVDEFENIMF